MSPYPLSGLMLIVQAEDHHPDPRVQAADSMSQEEDSWRVPPPPSSQQSVRVSYLLFPSCWGKFANFSILDSCWLQSPPSLDVFGPMAPPSLQLMIIKFREDLDDMLLPN